MYWLAMRLITGTKFFLTADPSQAYLEELLGEIYELYIDYALKNPFYDIEQPIQNVCEKFVTNLEALIQTIQKGGAPKSVTGSTQTATLTWQDTPHTLPIPTNGAESNKWERLSVTSVHVPHRIPVLYPEWLHFVDTMYIR